MNHSATTFKKDWPGNCIFRMICHIKQMQDELPIAATLTAKIDRPIVLIGLMGAGKSTIGRRLAKVIERDFVDSDDEIERSAGCSISDIFSIHGEPIFRDLEQRVIFRLLEHKNLVLATGGGAWMQDHIREKIKEHALSIWLHADLDILVERVEKRSHRPLLEHGDKREILSDLIAKRYPVYQEADMCIHTSDEQHESVVEKVIHRLNEQGDAQHVA